jgi:hypothetical protein
MTAAVTDVPVFAIAVVQLEPDVDESSMTYPVIDEPPVLVGADQVSEIAPSLGVATNVAGATGADAGVAEVKLDVAPTPPAFRAETRNTYAVPFVRPLTARVVVVDAVSTTTTVQVMPPLLDCSMR